MGALKVRKYANVHYVAITWSVHWRLVFNGE